MWLGLPKRLNTPPPPGQFLILHTWSSHSENCTVFWPERMVFHIVWLSLTPMHSDLPLKRDSAISLMYDGTMTHRAPTPMPCMTRAADSIHTEIGHVSIIQPTNTNPSYRIILPFRPHKLVTYPTGSTPNSAPMPNTELNVCMSLSVTRNGNLRSVLNMSCTGDDHPNIVPLTSAPNVAAMIITMYHSKNSTALFFI